MPDERTIKFKEAGAKIMALFCCIMPVIFVPFVWDGYYIPKVICLYITVILLFIMCARFNCNPFSRALINKNNTAVAVLIYCAAVIISTIFALDFKMALFGSIFRLEGALTLISYAVIFLFASCFSRELLNFKYGKWLVISCSAISLYGILQRYGIEILPVDSRRALWRASSFATIGNPNFLGSFLCLCIPLAATAFIISGNKFIFSMCAVQAYALLCSETQSAWIGAFVAFCIIVLFFLKNGERKNKRRLLYLSIMLIILILFYQAQFGTVFFEIKAMFFDFYRLCGYFMGRNGYKSAVSGGKYRIFIWQYAIKLIAMFPVFGVGSDCMSIALNKYFVKNAAFRKDLLMVLDRAHNEYLHVAVSTGIFGMILFLFIIISSIFKGIKRAKEGDTETFAVLCSITAYAVQAFFNISVVSVAPIFWIFMGLVSGAGENKQNS